jgi:DNA polymerase-1
MSKTLYVIDGYALIYSSYFAPMMNNLTSPTGEPTKAVYIFVNTLLGMMSRREPDYLVVAMDSGKTFRNELYPEYKAHRPPMPEDMKPQVERITQILEAMRIPVLTQDGFEADDIIGTLAAKAEKEGLETYICSKDKDMIQLLNERVFMYDIKNDVVQDLKWLKENKGLSPEQFADVLALMGDSADNVPGVRDVGPKTAEQWIVKYGSINGLYEHVDDIKGKRGDSLRSNKDMAMLSRKLVEIRRDCPLEPDWDEFAVKEYDEEALGEVFAQLGFKKLLAQFGIEKDVQPHHSKTAGLFDAPVAAEPPPTETLKTRPHEYKLINTPELLADFATELSKQKFFAIDTETTGLDSMRASLVGISACWEAGKAFYIPVRAPFGEDCLAVDDVRDAIGGVLADESIKKIGQNIKYDMAILKNAGFELAGITFDTMIASYLLNAERNSNSMDAMAKDYLAYECVPISDLIGKGKKQTTFDTVELEAACEYAAEDADVTLRLYEYLAPKLAAEPELQKLFDEVEMPLMHVLSDIEMTGVSIDSQLLRRMATDMADRIEQLTETIYDQTGHRFNIESPKQLSEILFDRLLLPQIKKRSTDASVLEKLQDFHPVIGNILQFRQLVKLKGTYLDKLGAMVNPRTNRLHCSFNQTIAATGRLSSSNPNLQNIPVRTEEGRLIRSAFIPADKNGVILSADYSQVELRLLAHLSRDEELVRAFNEDKDIHRFVAAQVFGVREEDVDSAMRAKAKAVNFGVIYGQGAYALSQSLGISQTEAKDFINGYFERYSSIKSFMTQVLDEARKTGYARTILGRRRAATELTTGSKMAVNAAERMVFNTTIQGSAADLIKVAMVNIHKEIRSGRLDAKMLMQIHDELVFEMDEAKAAENAAIIKEIMENALELSVKLKVDVGWGKNWMTGH